MSQPIDRVFVEVEARGEDDAARDIHDALKEVERDAAAIADEISRAFSDAADDIADDMSSATKNVSRKLNELKSDAHDTGTTISTSIRTGTTRATDAIDDLADNADRDFARIRRAARSLGSTISTLGRDATNFFSGITTSSRIASRALAGLGIAGGPAGLAASLAALSAVAEVLIPIIVGLGGVFVDLAGAIGLLPAAAGIAGTVMGTLAFAFSGVSDAVDALASGDLDKINKALNKLSPSARALAQELNGLRGPLGELRKSVQEAFFSQFTGQLTLLARDALPVMRTGLTDVASALGDFVNQVIQLLRSSESLDTFSKIFETTGRIIRNLTPSVIELFGAILNAAEAGLPFVERLFGSIAQGISNFATFLNQAIQSGEFNQFLEDALTAMRNLGQLAFSVGQLLFTIFSGAGDEGNSFIQSLITATDQLTAFFQSAEGQETLQELLETLKSIGNAIIGFVNILITAQQVQNSIKDAFTSTISTVVTAVGQFFSTLVGWVQSAISAVGGFFTSIGAFFSSIGQSLVNAYNQVVAFGGQIITFFQSLPGRIVAFLQSLPSMIGSVFMNMFDTVFYLIGFGLGTIIRFFMELPGRVVAAINALVGFVAGVFNTVHTRAVQLTASIVASVVTFFRTLPGRVLSAINSVISFVSNVFNSVHTRAISIAARIVAAVVSFFRQLPGRIMSAINAIPGLVIGVFQRVLAGAVNVGRAIVEGIGRGISAGVGAIIALARRAANRILEGMKDALGIDSPSKVARVEVGREIGRGVGVGITDSEPEVSRMLDDFTRNIIPGITTVNNGGDTSQSVAFGPGAIQVVVAGGTSASDARAIGATIGASINDILTRRNTRIRVRTT